MDNIEQSRTKPIVGPKGSNLMYNCTENFVVHLSTILDDAKRIKQAKEDIDARIKIAKESNTQRTISYRIGLISFKNPEDSDLNPVQLELVQFYRDQGYTVMLGIMAYHIDTTHYLTMDIKLQSP